MHGSTPRTAGATIALTPDRDFAGSVSGRRIEADVFEHALKVIAGGDPRLVTCSADNH